MNRISTFSGHTQEVCGLSWSPDGSTLASGGNENLLCIWDAATGTGELPFFLSFLLSFFFLLLLLHVFTFYFVLAPFSVLYSFVFLSILYACLILFSFITIIFVYVLGGNPPLSSASTSSFIGPRLAIDQHIAAVKAVSWCPWTRHTLASGGTSVFPYFFFLPFPLSFFLSFFFLVLSLYYRDEH